MYKGEILTTLQLNESEIDTVFGMMKLFHWDKTREIMEHGLGCIYGHMKDAAPMHCNGLPMFFAWQFLDKPDTKKLIKIYNKLLKKMRKYDKGKRCGEVFGAAE